MHPGLAPQGRPAGREGPFFCRWRSRHAPKTVEVVIKRAFGRAPDNEGMDRRNRRLLAQVTGWVQWMGTDIRPGNNVPADPMGSDRGA